MTYTVKGTLECGRWQGGEQYLRDVAFYMSVPIKITPVKGLFRVKYYFEAECYTKEQAETFINTCNTISEGNCD